MNMYTYYLFVLLLSEILHTYIFYVFTDCVATLDCASTDVPLDCQDIYDAGYDVSGDYVCAVCLNAASTLVRCEMEAGTGWTVLLRRVDNSISFFRFRDEYIPGFGDPHHEYWIGLDNIHNLTYTKPYQLQVVVTDFKNQVGYAYYDIFEVDDDSNQYQINVGGFTAGSPDAGNSLTHSSYGAANIQGRKFSTPDHDHDYDTNSGHCAAQRGGWWMKSCQRSCLTAHYKIPNLADSFCMNWASHTANSNRCLKASEMRIRPI